MSFAKTNPDCDHTLSTTNRCVNNRKCRRYLIFRAWKESLFLHETVNVPFRLAKRTARLFDSDLNQPFAVFQSAATRWWNSWTIQVGQFCRSPRKLLRFITWASLCPYLQRASSLCIFCQTFVKLTLVPFLSLCYLYFLCVRMYFYFLFKKYCFYVTWRVIKF